VRDGLGLIAVVMLAAAPVQAERLSEPAQMVLDTIAITFDCAIDESDLPSVQGEFGLSDDEMKAVLTELSAASLLLPGDDGVFRASDEEQCS
jgi:hypothetical protein